MTASASRRGSRSRPAQAGAGKFELLPVEPGFGLTRLPEPSDGDIFLDLEGDPFVGEHGLEYLFGYLFKDAARRARLRGRLGLHARRREAGLRDIRRFRHGAVGAISRPAHLSLRAIRASGPEAADGPLRDAGGRDRPHAPRRAVRRSLSGRAPRPARERRKLFDQAAGAVLRIRARDAALPMRTSRSPNLQANLELDDTPVNLRRDQGDGARLQRG